MSGVRVSSVSVILDYFSRVRRPAYIWVSGNGIAGGYAGAFLGFNVFSGLCVPTLARSVINQRKDGGQRPAYEILRRVEGYTRPALQVAGIRESATEC